MKCLRVNVWSKALCVYEVPSVYEYGIPVLSAKSNITYSNTLFEPPTINCHSVNCLLVYE